MSVEALAACWGRQFPVTDPFTRLVALRIADGMSPEAGANTLVNSLRVRSAIAEACGLDEHAVEPVQDALDRLCAAGVLTDFGTYYRWEWWS